MINAITIEADNGGSSGCKPCQAVHALDCVELEMGAKFDLCNVSAVQTDFYC